MTFKETIINTIKGKKTGHVPFIPRLDIWYKSNKLRNKLPKKYKDCTLDEIVKDMGLGFHTIVPDFSNYRGRKSVALSGLGISDLKTNPYKINTGNLDFDFKTDSSGVTQTIYRTPFGSITTKTLYDCRMKESGATIGHTLEHAFKTAADANAIGYIFENIKVEKNYKDFAEYKDSIGENGIAVAFCMLSASPMHHIMKSLCPFESFVYQLHDNPKVFESIAQKIDIFFSEVVNIAASSDAEVVFCGANYDSFLTWPLFFKQYITSYLKKYSAVSHQKGKFFLTHADGENEGLINEYVEGCIDIADSICPYPMTKLKLEDIRRVFAGKITIWGGIPSICTLEEFMNEYEFDRYLYSLADSIGRGEHIILSFADTTPPDAKFERIGKVAEFAESLKLS